MPGFSKRSTNLAGSKTMRIAELCREKIKQGHDVVAMNIGDSDLVTPLAIQAAAIEAIHAGHSKYSSSQGLATLRELVVERVNKEHTMSISADNTLITPGLKQAIFYAIMTTVDPGDEVIIPAPYWPSFVDIVNYAGGVPVILKTTLEDNFQFSPEALEATITPKTKMLILTSPNNPTGLAISRKMMSSYGAVLSRHPDIWIMLDYIYQYIYWGDEPLAYMGEVCPHLQNRLIILGGFSKSYAISGWRLGYLCTANHELSEAILKLQQQTVTHPSTISQFAAIEAIKHDREIHSDAVTSFKARYEFLYKALSELNDIELIPSDGALYLFPRVTQLVRKLGLRDDIALAEYLLEHAHISVTPGSFFGAEGHLRFSFALCQDRLDVGVKNLKRLPVFELT